MITTRTTGNRRKSAMTILAILVLSGMTLLCGGCKDEFKLDRDNKSFNLDALLNQTDEQGSIQAPVDITGQLPFSGETGNQFSYYVVNDVSTDIGKMFTLSEFNNDLDLYVYNNAGFSNLKCFSDNSDTKSERCYFPVQDSTLYIKVDGRNSFSGSTFVLDMKDLPSTEGTEETPVDITGNIPHSGKVDETSSYYSYTGLNAGASYKISITGASDAIDLFVYQTTGLFIFTTTTLACFDYADFSGESYDVECSTVAYSSSLLIETDGSRSEIGSYYNLNIHLPPSNQGSSGNPVNITAQTPYSGQVGSGSSYYMITGLTPGQSYTVSMTGLDHDVDLFVFDDNDLMVSLCSSNNWFSTDESCQATPSSDSLFIVSQAALFITGSYFTLDVQ